MDNDTKKEICKAFKSARSIVLSTKRSLFAGLGNFSYYRIRYYSLSTSAMLCCKIC